MSDAAWAQERAREAMAAFDGRGRDAALLVVADLFERHAAEQTAALRAALEPWVRHKDKCASSHDMEGALGWWYGDETLCNCGLASALGFMP